jgi:hypothetical protein
MNLKRRVEKLEKVVAPTLRPSPVLALAHTLAGMEITPEMQAHIDEKKAEAAARGERTVVVDFSTHIKEN